MKMRYKINYLKCGKRFSCLYMFDAGDMAPGLQALFFYNTHFLQPHVVM